MKLDKKHPYYKRTWWRIRLPFFLINLGFAQKGIDCENENAEHHWYKIDNNHSGCYYYKVLKKRL
jgi:hypothetical protein